MGKTTLEDGFEFLRGDRVFEAFEVFEDISNQEPKNALPRLFMGDILLLNDEVEEGTRAHKEAMSLDERCSYPVVHILVEDREVRWDIKMNYLSRLRYRPKEGIMFEASDGRLHPINLGVNQLNLEIPSNHESTTKRTESLQALMAPIHPYLGPFRALIQESLEVVVRLQTQGFEQDLPKRKKPRRGKEKESMAYTTYGTAFEVLDDLELAIDSYSWALTLHPWNLAAENGLMKSLKRKHRGEKISDFFSLHFAQRALAPDSTISMADSLYAASDDLQIALRIFEFIGNNER